MEFLIGGHIAEFRRMLEDIRAELEALKQLVRELANRS